jgi:surface protein
MKLGLGHSLSGGVVPAAAAADTSFTFTINTENAGSATKTFVLPLINDGTINFTVDWGDSSTDTITAYNQAEITHLYSATGTYTIQITGTIRGWKFNNGGDKLKILNISQWGDMNLTQGYAFMGCSNLTSDATDAPTITTTSFYRMFQTCSSLTGLGTGISSWDTSSVTTMRECFKYNTIFNGNISSWDVSNVTTFQAMLDRCNAFNQNIGGWTTSSATSFREMIKSTDPATSSFDQNISGWDISGVSNMFNFLYGQTLSTANYDALLIEWDAQSAVSSVAANFGSSTYTGGGTAAAARANLIASDLWTITDGGIA